MELLSDPSQDICVGTPTSARMSPEMSPSPCLCQCHGHGAAQGWGCGTESRYLPPRGGSRGTSDVSNTISALRAPVQLQQGTSPGAPPSPSMALGGDGGGYARGVTRLVPIALAGHGAAVHGGDGCLTHHTPVPSSPRPAPAFAGSRPHLPGNAEMIHLGDFFLLLTEGSKAPGRAAAA